MAGPPQTPFLGSKPAWAAFFKGFPPNPQEPNREFRASYPDLSVGNTVCRGAEGRERQFCVCGGEPPSPICNCGAAWGPSPYLCYCGWKRGKESRAFCPQKKGPSFPSAERARQGEEWWKVPFSPPLLCPKGRITKPPARKPQSGTRRRGSQSPLQGEGLVGEGEPAGWLAAAGGKHFSPSLQVSRETVGALRRVRRVGWCKPSRAAQHAGLPQARGGAETGILWPEACKPAPQEPSASRESSCPPQRAGAQTAPHQAVCRFPVHGGRPQGGTESFRGPQHWKEKNAAPHHAIQNKNSLCRKIEPYFLFRRKGKQPGEGPVVGIRQGSVPGNKTPRKSWFKVSGQGRI